MTNNFCALCADLIEAVLSDDSHIDCTEIARRARAALGEADKPAVPECREPAAVTGQPSDEELALIYHDCCRGCEFMDQVNFENAARAVLTHWGNPAPAPPADVSQLSDGYHTFAELYEHRHSLMLALMRALPRICWFSRRHADGELPFGSDDWFIVGAELPGAPITYHLPAALYSLAQKTGALELPAGRPWDGHSAADVVHRLRDWAIEPAPPADGEVADVVRWLKARAGIPASPDFPAVAAYLTRAAEMLQRQVPVPVSERLPGPSDCAPWPKDSDASAWCWVGTDQDDGWNWEQRSAGCLAMFPDDFTHWLPAHALPLPEVNNG